MNSAHKLAEPRLFQGSPIVRVHCFSSAHHAGFFHRSSSSRQGLFLLRPRQRLLLQGLLSSRALRHAEPPRLLQSRRGLRHDARRRSVEEARHPASQPDLALLRRRRPSRHGVADADLRPCTCLPGDARALGPLARNHQPAALRHQDDLQAVLAQEPHAAADLCSHQGGEVRARRPRTEGPRPQARRVGTSSQDHRGRRRHPLEARRRHHRARARLRASPIRNRLSPS